MMNSKKGYFFNWLLLLVVVINGSFNTIISSINTTIYPKKKIILISIPKCGTHLISKLFYMIVFQNHVSIGWNVTTETLDSSLSSLLPSQFLRNHLTYSDENTRILDRHDVIGFFIIRDPRDQIVSNTYYTRNFFLGPWQYTIGLSFDENIMELIVGGSGYQGIVPGAKNIDSFYKSFLPWMNNQRFYCVRFEDLVGSNGNGSDQAQFETIKGIARHMGIELSADEIKKITKTLWGVEKKTFREGKVGCWKTHFKEEHKQAIKKIAGQLLIDLGYEDNDGWQ